MTPFTRVADLARQNHRVITLAQLLSLGLSDDAIRHLVATERLWRPYRGVYALEGPLTPHGWTMAAVRRCQPHAGASRFSAAALLDMSDHWPERPQVTIARRSGATGPSTIDVRSSMPQLRFGTAHGIPVTSPAQTVIDCAPHLDDKNLKAMLRRAEYNGLDLEALRRPHLPPNLRRLLDVYVVGSGLTASELEARFYELCAGAGLPAPEIQARFADRRVDFVWHPIRLIAETDGRRAHDTYIARTDDAARDRRHLLDGYATMRFTWTEVERSPDAVAADLIAAHELAR